MEGTESMVRLRPVASENPNRHDLGIVFGGGSLEALNSIQENLGRLTSEPRNTPSSMSTVPTGGLIPTPPSESPNGPPVLFVHGMWHADWCWELFLAVFLTAGFNPKAMNLTEHARRQGEPRRLQFWSLEEFVNDLKRAIAQFKTTPILVGHSLGCLLIEIVLAEVRPPAVVLLAPTRHDIFRRSVWEFFKRHPFRFLQLVSTFTMWPPICTPELCREMLFSRTLPEADLLKWHGHLQNESFRVTNQLLWGCGPRPAPHSGIPTYVLIGGADQAVSVKDAKLVAADHGTDVDEIPGMPHDLMLDLGAADVADRIIVWLRKTVPSLTK